MKKVFSIFLILLFLLSIVLAQTPTTNNQTQNNISKEKIKNIIKNPTTKIDEKLEEEIQIPQGLQTVSRIIFGIKSEKPISFATFIILIAFWIFIVLLIANIIKVSGFLSMKGFLKWLFSAIFTTLLSSTGATIQIAQFWSGLGSIIPFVKESSTFALIISGIIFAIIAFIILKIFDKFNKQIEEENALDTGRKVSLGILKLKKEGESVSKPN